MTTAFGIQPLLVPTFRIGPAVGYERFVLANRRPSIAFAQLGAVHQKAERVTIPAKSHHDGISGNEVMMRPGALSNPHQGR